MTIDIRKTNAKTEANSTWLRLAVCDGRTYT